MCVYFPERNNTEKRRVTDGRDWPKTALWSSQEKNLKSYKSQFLGALWSSLQFENFSVVPSVILFGKINSDDAKYFPPLWFFRNLSSHQSESTLRKINVVSEKRNIHLSGNRKVNCLSSRFQATQKEREIFNHHNFNMSHRDGKNLKRDQRYIWKETSSPLPLLLRQL